MVQAVESIDLGLVSQCDVTSCTYNKGQQCTAGAVYVTFVDALPKCYTYTKEPESLAPVVTGAGDVSQCDVIDCTYNEGQRCIADEITVSFKSGVAQCATYSYLSEASGS